MKGDELPVVIADRRPGAARLGVGGVGHQRVVLPLDLVLLDADLLHPSHWVTDDVGELILGDGERLSVDPDDAEIATGVACRPRRTCSRGRRWRGW